MALFLDTSFIIPLLIDSEKTDVSREFFDLSNDISIITTAVFEESFFVGLKLVALDVIGRNEAVRLREYIKSNGYEFADLFLHNLKELCENLEIHDDIKDILLIEQVARKYRLMPNDALIAAFCLKNAITSIVTYDSDFLRVPAIKVIQP
jgi:hypothetical protein